MKNTLLIFLFSIILSGCYNYVAIEAENAKSSNTINENTELISSKLNNVRSTNSSVLSEEDIPNLSTKNKSKVQTTKVDSTNIKITDLIKANMYYKVDVNNKEYKIQAKQWKADTLYAIEKGKPTKELKFHKDEISDVKIRKFSKGKSDALTIAAYALGAVGVFLLLK